MPEENVVQLNSAARDVVAERQRQVNGEGHSLWRDDLYVKNELAEAAAVYATLAGKPGHHSTAWPWGYETFKASSDRRRDLVKAGALILAEIERLDRTKLIQHWPIKRDKDGMFTHPDLPDFDEDHDKYRQWIAEQGLAVVAVDLEGDAPEELAERYFEAGDPDCSYWEPTRPEGEGWFCLSIHDTDNGPYCFWARREVTP